MTYLKAHERIRCIRSGRSKNLVEINNLMRRSCIFPLPSHGILALMTNYNFGQLRSTQPERPTENIFTEQLRKKVAQRKAERKEVLERVWRQRARVFRRLLQKRKIA